MNKERYSLGDSTKRTLRRFAAWAVACGFLGAVSPLSAQDVAEVCSSLQSSSDFRVRVAAALALGNQKELAARQCLESGLTDIHGAVRSASAAAMAALGDKSGAPALRVAMERELSDNVKSQMESSLRKLTAQQTKATQVVTVPKSVKPKFLVSLGHVESRMPIDSAVLDQFRKQTIAMMSDLPSVEFYSNVSDLHRESKARGLVPFTLDGVLTELKKGTVDARTGYSAKVEYVVQKMPERSLKGTVFGSASAVADGRFDHDTDLRDSAVNAAVESALKGAPVLFESVTSNKGAWLMPKSNVIPGVENNVILTVHPEGSRFFAQRWITSETSMMTTKTL